MAWALRGLRNGVVTTRYPRHADAYADAFPGGATVIDRATVTPDVASVCPTGAIRVQGERPQLDRGRCIGCGACIRLHPDAFDWEMGSETARLERSALIVPESNDGDSAAVDAARRQLAARVRALRRSVHLRHVDAGSDGAEEWEIQALVNPVYDVHRLGIFFTASPRHADILLVTGVGALGMVEPLRRTYTAMPQPVVVIAVGTDAVSGGLVGTTYATSNGVTDALDAGTDIDVWVPGSPPSPFAILSGILLALGRLPTSGGRESA